MNVFYSLIKMKERFFNIIIYLVCCQCLILHSSATENSTVTATEQTIQLNGTESGIGISSIINFSPLNSSIVKIVYLNQTAAIGNGSKNDTNKVKSEVKLPTTTLGVSHDTTELSKQSTMANVNGKADKMSEKEKSTNTIHSTEVAETETSAATASNHSRDGEEKPSNSRDERFDGPSFIGGIILAVGIIGFGYVAYKFCSKRTNINYRNV